MQQMHRFFELCGFKSLGFHILFFLFFEFCPNGKYVLYLMKMYNSGVVGVDPMGPTSVLNGN